MAKAARLKKTGNSVRIAQRRPQVQKRVSFLGVTVTECISPEVAESGGVTYIESKPSERVTPVENLRFSRIGPERGRHGTLTTGSRSCDDDAPSSLRHLAHEVEVRSAMPS